MNSFNSFLDSVVERSRWICRIFVLLFLLLVELLIDLIIQEEFTRIATKFNFFAKNDSYFCSAEKFQHS